MDGENGQQDTGGSNAAPEIPSRHELLERMGALAERVTATLLAPHNLTPAQARVLGAVDRLGPHVAVADIASATAFPFGAVTSILDRLFLRRLIERTDTGGPGQRITCSLTEDGHTMIQALSESRSALYARLLDGFNDEELILIGRLASRMEDEVASGVDLPAPAEERSEPAPAPVLRLIKGHQSKN